MARRAGEEVCGGGLLPGVGTSADTVGDARAGGDGDEGDGQAGENERGGRARRHVPWQRQGVNLSLDILQAFAPRD